MNPLMSGMSNIMQVSQMVSQLRNNPNGIADLLKSRGRISEEQYTAIQKMGNPQQIGQYLMQNGMINGQQAMQAVQGIVPQIQSQTK